MNTEAGDHDFLQTRHVGIQGKVERHRLIGRNGDLLLLGVKPHEGGTDGIGALRDVLYEIAAIHVGGCAQVHFLHYHAGPRKRLIRLSVGNGALDGTGLCQHQGGSYHE
jgi:hypothetical protein